jgi:NADH-ubiquinone oxidoreductase chain 6
MTTLFMNLLGFLSILSSILTITAKNPVISVIFLIFTFVAAAAYLILIGIQFIGISYIVIYVGAIAVLFLFVIMMINIKLTDILETGTQYTKNLPLAITIGSLFLFIIYSIIPLNFFNVPSLLLYNLNIFNSLGIMMSGPSLNYSNLEAAMATAISPLSNNNDFSILDFLQIEALGISLYTSQGILLIILSFILLLAMVATIVLSKK